MHKYSFHFIFIFQYRGESVNVILFERRLNYDRIVCDAKQIDTQIDISDRKKFKKVFHAQENRHTQAVSLTGTVYCKNSGHRKKVYEYVLYIVMLRLMSLTRKQW